MKLFDFFKKPDRRTKKRRTGDKGEAIAAEFLKQHGYLILEQNWTYGKAELDIIAMKNGTVIFVEVKTTNSDFSESFKLPMEAIDKQKRQNLTHAARAYVRLRKQYFPRTCEGYAFDIIEVYLNRETPQINHITNAFFAEKGYKTNGKSNV